jgi:hypothetical protein
MASIVQTIIDNSGGEYKRDLDIPPKVFFGAYSDEKFFSLGGVKVISDDRDYEYLLSKVKGFKTAQKNKIFDGEFELGADEGVESLAAMLAGPLGVLYGQIVAAQFLWNGQGGIIRHFQDIVKSKDYSKLTETKANVLIHFFKDWYKQAGGKADSSEFLSVGLSDPENKKNALIKSMIEISKKFPTLFLGDLIPLKEFGYRNFALKITDAINEWLTELPNKTKIDGLDVSFEGKNEAGIKLRFKGGESIDLAWKEEEALKVFSKALVEYLNPFPTTDNINDIKLKGPIDTLEFVGGPKDAGILDAIAGWFGSISVNPAEKLYVEFVDRALIDISSLKSLGAKDLEDFDLNIKGPSGSWEALFNKLITEAVNKTGAEPAGGQIGYAIAQEILNALRRDTWNKLAKKLRRKKPGDVNVGELLKDSFADAEKDFNEQNADLVGDDTETELSEEDIEARQKFIKQCVLMTQLEALKNENRSLIAAKYGIHEKAPYDNRLHMLTAENKSSIPNKLIVPRSDKIKPFLEITPDIHAFLIPKIRLFKVFNKNDGTLDQAEFHFPNFTDPSRVNAQSFGTTFDKGDGAGIKDFSFSFEGTTPATARNDITADLTLYFQSFNDFIRKREFAGSQGKHAFVDLLLLPAGKSKKGYDTGSPLQYDPSYYRIRADIGWVISSKGDPELNKVLSSRGSSYSKLKEALRVTNKSFYLNMIDHDLQINDDGTVQIKASYRAYMENALKGTAMDSLATPEIKKERNRLKEEYQKIVAENKCTIEQLNEIKLIIAQIEKNLIKNSYRSIIDRLIVRGSMFYVTADRADMEKFASDGVFSKKVGLKFGGNNLGVESLTASEQINEQATEAIAKDGEKATYNLDTTFKDVDLSTESAWRTINFFFLGDLIYTILDCVYTNQQGEVGVSLENLRLLLGSFDYDNLYAKDGAKGEANIADIPISAEYFFEWYTENVIKKELTCFPVMSFVRQITNHLVVDILTENCFKISMNKNLRFNTGNFLATSGTGDVFSNTEPTSHGDHNLDILHDKNVLPFPSEDFSGNVNIRDFYNYILIYAVCPPLHHSGRGVKVLDGQRGIYHYQIGASKGLMKKVSFSKTDIQYLREARFFRNGYDGLMQLGNVYKVTMQMIGNTIYYPGMEFFIDPKGIGSGPQFDPTIGPDQGKASVANALGLGGYHLVTRVNSQLGPGKFTTTVEGMFIYSGDGNPRRLIDGEKEQKLNTVDTPIEKRDETCDQSVNALYKEALTDGKYKYSLDKINKKLEEKAP